MLSRLKLPILAAVFLAVFASANSAMWRNRADIRQTARAGYVMPSKFSRIMAIGHDGLFADHLMLQALTFFGERVMYQQEMSSADWDFLEAMLKTVSDLDPYFRDPYLLAEGLLAWEAGRVDVVNQLMEKGWDHRPDYWEFPFYLGFNYFYFLDKPGRAANYFMDASRLPGSPNFLPSLAARLSIDASQTKMGIVFLKSLITQTNDKVLTARYGKRLQALESIALLEGALQRYETDHGEKIGRFQKLLDAGYIREMPPEPYGGQWYLDSDGKIRSTSRLLEPSVGDK